MATTKTAQTTTDLFWTETALAEFQAAWDAGWTGEENVPAWVEWIWKIGREGQGFPSLKGQNWQVEKALTNDIYVKLFAAARTGCNKHLNETYYKLWSKWVGYGNDVASDYLAEAWNCLSTAQIFLARRWGAYIEWHTEF